MTKTRRSLPDQPRPSRRIVWGAVALALVLLFLLGACSDEKATVDTGSLTTPDTSGTPNLGATVTPQTGVAAITPQATGSLSPAVDATTQPTTKASPSTNPNTIVTALAATVTAQVFNTPEPTPDATALDPQAQHLTLLGGDDPQTLDPALASDNQSAFIVRQLFTGLVALDKNAQVVPDLAAALPAVSDDGLTYTFIMRSGARFQDGREITADDVKYSLERATDPKLADGNGMSLSAATYLNDITGSIDKLQGRVSTLSGVAVLGKYTVQIKLTAPQPAFLAKLSYVTSFVVNRATVESAADWWARKPNGSGPFILTNWTHQQSLTLSRNPSFYGGAAYLSYVKMLLGDTTNALAKYQQGDIDVLDVTGRDAEMALDKTRALNRDLSLVPELSLTYLGFNTRQKPFDDRNVRLAFSLAVDRARLARVMFDSQQVAARTILPFGLPGYTGNPGPLTYDVSKARDLLAASSYKKPENLPRVTLHATDTRIAGALKQIFKDALNVDVEVRLMSSSDFSAGLTRHEFPMFIYGWTADYPDPENFLGALFSATSPYNATAYASDSFEAALLEANRQTDPQKRLKLYASAEQTVLTDAPVLPLLHGITYELKKPYIKGLDSGLYGAVSLRRVYIDKAS